MKIRGLKHAFHMVFLIVGVFSLIMLAYTVNTYVSYADEGYGLEMSFDRASLNGEWLSLRFYFENPGGLDIVINTGNLTMENVYGISETVLPTGNAQNYPLTGLPAGENTSVVIWFRLAEPDLGKVRDSGQADIDLDLELWVPKRYMSTHISFTSTVGVSL